MIYLPLALITFSTVFKIIGGIVSKNTALLSDGLDSVKNVLSIAVSFYFYRKSEEIADEEHPFGHSKFDPLGSIIISVFMLSTSTFIITYSSLEFGKRPYDFSVKISAISSAIMFLCFISFLIITKKEKSLSLKAELYHEGLDFLQSIGVLISTILSLKTPQINSIFSIFIGLLLFVGGIRNFTKGTKYLLDVSISDEIKDKIKKIIFEEGATPRIIEGIEVGEGRIRVSTHITFPPETTLSEAHKIAHKIEERAKKIFKIENFIIHIEPDENKK